MVQHSSPGTVAPVQTDSVDQRSSKLMEMMSQLLTLVGQLEIRGQHEQNSGGPPKRQTERFSGGTVLCLVSYRCGQEGHLQEAVHNQGRSLQIRKLTIQLNLNLTTHA